MTVSSGDVPVRNLLRPRSLVYAGTCALSKQAYSEHMKKSKKAHCGKKNKTKKSVAPKSKAKGSAAKKAAKTKTLEKDLLM